MPDTSAEFSEERGHRSRDIGCYRISLSQLGNIRQSEEWSVISITRANNEYDESEDNQDEDESEGTEESEADDESLFMMVILAPKGKVSKKKEKCENGGMWKFPHNFFFTLKPSVRGEAKVYREGENNGQNGLYMVKVEAESFTSSHQ